MYIVYIKCTIHFGELIFLSELHSPHNIKSNHKFNIQRILAFIRLYCMSKLCPFLWSEYTMRIGQVLRIRMELTFGFDTQEKTGSELNHQEKGMAGPTCEKEMDPT